MLPVSEVPDGVVVGAGGMFSSLPIISAGSCGVGNSIFSSVMALNPFRKGEKVLNVCSFALQPLFLRMCQTLALSFVAWSSCPQG